MFKDFFKKNLNLKILSLLLALLLWGAVHLTQHGAEAAKTEVNLELPLAIENLSPHVLVLEAPTEVFVTVASPQKDTEQVKPSNFKAYVDVQGKQGGAYAGLPVKVASPPNFIATAVNPPLVDVVLDSESQKSVPVTWEIQKIKTTPRIQTNPQEIIVSGSKSQVDRVVAAQVEISQSPEATNIMQELTPTPIDALGRPVPGLHFDPGTVQVTILSSPLLRPVPVRPNVTGVESLQSPLTAISIVPPVVWADIPKNQNSPDYFSTEPIDVTGKQGIIIEKVKILVPPGVELHDTNQVTIMLKLEKS